MNIQKVTSIILFIILIHSATIINLYSNSNLYKVKYGLFYNFANIKTNINTQNFDNIIFPHKNIAYGGIGNYYGLFLLYELHNNSHRNVDIGFRLSFLNHTSHIEYDIYNTSIQAKTKQYISNIFDAFSFTPVIQTNIYNNFNIIFGLQLNVPILAEQNNSNNVKIYPTSFIIPRVQFGLNYPFVFGKSHIFSIVPEINVILGTMNDVTGNIGNWKSNYFTAGIAIQYNRENSLNIDTIEQIEYENILYIDTIKRIAKIEKETIKAGNVFTIDTITIHNMENVVIQYISKRIDTIFIPSNVLFDVKTKLTAHNIYGESVKVDSNFKISSSVEYISLEEIPLLNKIFFHRNSAILPDRYKQRTINSDFDTNKTLTTTIETYYDILNIIGQRMSENNHYTLKLVGCNDNNTDEEKNNLDLSKARAENIKQYLVKNWKINSNRIVTEARGLPENPSLKETESLKIEENRRVEIYTNDNSLFNPIISENKVNASNFEKLQIDAKVLSNEGIKKYIIIQKLNNKIIREISVEYPEKINGTYNFTEHLPLNIRDITDDANMQIILLVTTNSNNTKTNIYNLPIKYSDDILTTSSQFDTINPNIQTNIDKNYLVLFGLNDADISAEELNIVSDIQNSIDDESQIYIVGLSDINGNNSHNQRLALNRANNIKKILNIPTAIVESAKDMHLFDNSLPEGRFYSRAVKITISFAKRN